MPYHRYMTPPVFLALLLSITGSLFGQLPEIVINEFLASNQTGLADPDFGHLSDWVELYNSSPGSITLSGYFLSDDLDDPTKWQFPENTILPAQGYLLVWADDEATGLHTNFKLGKSGEALVLSDADSSALDSIRFGVQADDISFGRLPTEPLTWTFFSPASPGEANDITHTVPMTPEPLFSQAGGFYSGIQWVSFQEMDQTEIYYSLDGTPPDDAATLYTGPLSITETTALRAIAYQTGKPPSAVITHTYFIDIPVNLPVVSLVTDPANFFDDEIGIYVTGVNGTGGYCAGVVSNVNQAWERPVNIEFYSLDGEQGLNQRAGVKIFGGCSRHRYPQKSLALFARSDYGDGSFSYPLFTEKDIDSFESFILRSSADDQVYTLFRDAAAQESLAGHMDADYQAYEPVVVYLNGVYWGIHNLREKLNEHYVAGNFGVDPEEVNLLSRDGSDWNTAHGSNVDYLSMLDFVTSHSMADPINFALVKDMMEVDQYIDYMIGHIYLAENDWPGNNIKFWKANSGEYNRWRWMNYDMDQSLMYYRITENMIDKCTTTTGPGWPNPEWSTRLFRNLLENEEFRQQFLNQYAWHMNSTFEPAHLLSLIDSLADRLRPEMPQHIERWGGMLDATGSAAESWIPPTFDSMDAWEANIEQMRDFARERQFYTVQNMVAHFGLSGASHIQTHSDPPQSGVIHLLDRVIPSDFAGLFFNDIPLHLNATPMTGYQFSHWEVQTDTLQNAVFLGLGSEWKYHDLGSNLGTAWRGISYNDASWASGPAQLGYGDGDEATIIGYGGNPNNKYITSYFRRVVVLAADQVVQTLNGTILVDDGALVFLNGMEIFRVNMPDGPVGYTTTALTAIADENAYHPFSVPPELLVAGTNIVAVEIHQSSATSSDISFDCALSGSLTSGGNWTSYATPDLELVLGGDLALTAHFITDTASAGDPVVITEINYRSAEDHNTEDWIELYNRSGGYLEMTGWNCVDGDGQSFHFPDGFLLGPESFVVLCRDAQLFQSFHPQVDLVLGDMGFGLSSTGDRIQIVDPANEPVDEVEFGVVAPWPTTAGGTGYTIELMDVFADNSLGENWTAAHLHGSPGEPFQNPASRDEAGSAQPAQVMLYPNTPNPFNPSTRIHYSLDRAGLVWLSIYSLSGQKIRNLVNQQQNAGFYQISWDGLNEAGVGVASGVYIARLHSGNTVAAQKLLLLR